MAHFECHKWLTGSVLTSWTYLICITMSNFKWSCSNSSLWKAQTGLNTDILDKAYRSICIQNPLQSIHKWEQASTTLKAKVDGHYFNLAHMFGLVISASFCSFIQHNKLTLLLYNTNTYLENHCQKHIRHFYILFSLVNSLTGNLSLNFQ